MTAECDRCGGYMEDATSHPSRSGRCVVYLICTECGNEVKSGYDSVL